MKNSTFLLVLLLAPIALFANEGKYLEAMQKNIKDVYEAKDIQSLQNTVNAFERIAGVENSLREPLYYMAFGNIVLANLEGTAAQKDAYLDRAMEAIEKAKTLQPSESEIIALEGFCYMMRIPIAPQTRGMVYAPQAMQAFEKALKLSPENPRALALMAQMQFGTTQFFGSSTAEACSINATAAEKFLSFKSENALAPTWGNGMIESLKEKCK